MEIVLLQQIDKQLALQLMVNSLLIAAFHLI